MVLLVDDLTLTFDQIHLLKRDLHKWVNEEMRPGDLVAIWDTLHFNSVFQEFTSDKRVLNAAIDSIHWSVSRDIFARGVYGRFGATEMILNSLEELIAELRPVGGRKAIAIFSPGIFFGGASTLPNGNGTAQMSFANAYDPDLIRAYRDLIDSANRTGTVLYGIDMQGLDPFMNSVYTGETYKGEAGMQWVTEPTGGFAVVNSNGFAHALTEIEVDQDGYYLIGFSAPEDIRVTKSGAVDFKRLAVRVKSHGLTVRSRKGFWAETDQAAEPKLNADTQLRLALRSLFREADILVRLSPFYTKTTDGKSTVRNLIYVDAKNLKFVPRPNGTEEANLELMVTAVGYSTKPLALISKKLVFDVKDQQLPQTRRDGLLFEMDVPAPPPGAYQVRAAVRDDNSNALGSAGEFIPIPNLKKQELALTTPFLDKASLPSGERYTGHSAALRQFAPRQCS